VHAAAVRTLIEAQCMNITRADEGAEICHGLRALATDLTRK
jgi:hypothetical protein